ncbi:MAG: hypothetical protein HGA52_08155, partial [Bacteroidales bacterium]|nr:hypothetical protein [Bacteroidales bacterium]
AGINNPSSGEVLRPSSIDIGYLPQQMDHAKDKSVFDEAMMAFSHKTNFISVSYVKIDLIKQRGSPE